MSIFIQQSKALNVFLKCNLVSAEPVALTHLCRWVIRQTLTLEGIANGKIDELTLPKPIQDFLAFREPLGSNGSVIEPVCI